MKAWVIGILTLALPVSSGAAVNVRDGVLDEVYIQNHFLVSQAVYQTRDTNGALHDTCVVNAAGHPELVPSFAKTAPAGFQSSIQTKLPACSNNEVSQIAEASARAATGSQVAMLPALVITGLAICTVAAIAGGYNGFRNGVRDPLRDDWHYSSVTVGAAGAIAPLTMKTTLGAMAAYGATVTVGASVLIAATCAGLGHAGAYFAVKYYFE